MPHWEVVSHLAGVFSALLKVPTYSKSFLDAGDRAACTEVFAVAGFSPVCFQTVHNAHFAARAQTGNIPLYWHSGLLTFVTGAEGIAAGGILRSHTNNFVFFG